MVLILPKAETPGETFGKAFTQGLQRGTQRNLDFANQIAMEKYKRGLEAKQSLATLPPEYKSKLQGDYSEGALPTDTYDEQQQFEDPASAARALQEVQRLVQSGQPADYRKLYQENLAQKAQVQALTKSFTDEAEKALQDYDPQNKTIEPQTKARFAQYAKRNIYDRNLSEERKQFELKKEAGKLITSLRNLENIKPESRIGTFLTGKALGTLSGDNAEIKKIRNQINPLIEQGYSPEVKASLAKSGFAPEEIAYVTEELKPSTLLEIKNMPQPDKKGLLQQLKSVVPKALFSTISRLPMSVASSIIDPEYKPTEDMTQNFNTGIETILANDPGANLLMLRREYEKNGIDWRTFQNKIFDMINAGTFVPTDSQQQDIRVNISKPPLDVLDKLLYGIGLRGR